MGKKEQSVALTKAKESALPKKKTVQKKQKSRVAPIGQYFRDVRLEFRKVIWPGRDEIISSTIVVLTALAFFAILIGVLDFAFAQVVELIIP